MRVNNICCLGGTLEGLVTCSVFALKCPEIRITVVDSEDVISTLNLKDFTSSEPGLEEIVKKCRNRNLFFTTSQDPNIKDADLIIIPHTVTVKNKGRGVNVTMNFGKLEEAAKIIATFSDSDKIVVEKTTVSAKAVEKISTVLNSYVQHGTRFNIISNPECNYGPQKVFNLLNPRCVMIGCQKNPNARAAAQSLFEIYEHWVPQERIIVMHNWSAEISQIAEVANVAQKMCSINALAIVCEETGVDFNSQLSTVILEHSKLNMSDLSPSLGFGKERKAVMSMIFTCLSLNLPEAADYWESVLKMNAFHMNRFIIKVKRILCPFNEKSIAILGFATEKNSSDATLSPAITVCDELLRENCSLKIYDPAVSSEQISKALELDFVPSKKAKVQFFNDVYMAIFESHAIIICTAWDEFLNLDYARIARWMKTPVVIDGHTLLKGIGLKDKGMEYYTIGS